MKHKKVVGKRSMSSDSIDSDDLLAVDKAIDEVTSPPNPNILSKTVSDSKPNITNSNWDLNDPYQFGLWSKPLEHLWHFRMCNEKAEIEFNKNQALIEPHCCLCQYFVPKALAIKSDTVPEFSRRILTDLSFIRNTETATVPMEDSQELDRLLTCSHCYSTVHAKCYGAQLTDKQSKSAWTCERCRVSLIVEQYILNVVCITAALLFLASWFDCRMPALLFTWWYHASNR